MCSCPEEMFLPITFYSAVNLSKAFKMIGLEGHLTQRRLCISWPKTDEIIQLKKLRPIELIVTTSANQKTKTKEQKGFGCLAKHPEYTDIKSPFYFIRLLESMHLKFGKDTTIKWLFFCSMVPGFLAKKTFVSSCVKAESALTSGS